MHFVERHLKPHQALIEVYKVCKGRPDTMLRPTRYSSLTLNLLSCRPAGGLQRLIALRHLVVNPHAEGCCAQRCAMLLTILWPQKADWPSGSMKAYTGTKAKSEGVTGCRGEHFMLWRGMAAPPHHVTVGVANVRTSGRRLSKEVFDDGAIGKCIHTKHFRVICRTLLK